MERILKTQQDIDEFIFWVVCLQEEVLPQGKLNLQAKEGYCCLGVGVVCTVDNLEDLLIGVYPCTQLNAPQWLKEINNDYATKTGKSLSYANDSLDWTHKQIGDSLLEVYKDQLTL